MSEKDTLVARTIEKDINALVEDLNIVIEAHNVLVDENKQIKEVIEEVREVINGYMPDEEALCKALDEIRFILDKAKENK